MLRPDKAFTLIEVLVVLLIMATLFTMAATRLYSKNRKIKTSFIDLVQLNRRLQTLSEVHRQNYRLVFKVYKDSPNEYWVEKKQELDEKEQGTTKDFVNNKEIFVQDNTFFKKPKKIHPLLYIKEFEDNSLQKDFAREENIENQNPTYYIYYHPASLSQEIAIQVVRRDNQAQWTLYRDPVTKELKILEDEKSLKEIQLQ